MKSFFLVFLIVLFFPILLMGEGPFYKDLVIHYSDFSYINSIAMGFNFIYFATSNGIIKYDLSTRSWAEPLNGKVGLSLVSVYDIAGSFDDQSVWARTDDGIFIYNGTLDQWDMTDEIPVEERRGRHVQPDGNYFAPWNYRYVNGGGLADSWNRIFQFTDLYEDGLNNVWIGTWGLGVCRTETTDRRIEIMNYGLLQPDVKIIFKDAGKLWMAGWVENAFRTGLTIFDPKRNKFEYMETEGSLISEPFDLNALCASNEEIFAAVDNGIWIIDKKNLEIVNKLGKNLGFPNDRITCLEISGDSLFTGTEYGLGIISIYPDSTDPVSKVVLKDYNITCLEKTDKSLWIGTDRGVFRYLFKKGRLEELIIAEADLSQYIYDLELDHGRMWISYQTGLVSIDLETAKVEVFPEIMKYGSLYKITANDTLLAGASDNGMVFLYNGIEKRNLLYTIDDGLLSNQINDLVFGDEYLWIGSDRGLTRFLYINQVLF
ncbi:MAG: hypothetical protein ABIJ45_04415 [Candidatus Zixiibacteriota bacterium]